MACAYSNLPLGYCFGQARNKYGLLETKQNKNKKKKRRESIRSLRLRRVRVAHTSQTRKYRGVKITDVSFETEIERCQACQRPLQMIAKRLKDLMQFHHTNSLFDRI